MQTWEDANVVHPETKAKGDNDPLDVCEIGELVARPGDIKQVKVLGIMALLDEEETDWKVVVIDINDPLAPKLNDIEDVERHLPGLLRATNEWFRIYKIPDGKPENQFAFSGECKNRKCGSRSFQTRADPKQVRPGHCPRMPRGLGPPRHRPGRPPWNPAVRCSMCNSRRLTMSRENITVSKSPFRVDPGVIHVDRGDNQLPAPIDPTMDKWFFISGNPSG
jgi:inorganic pyrophosphatase